MADSEEPSEFQKQEILLPGEDPLKISLSLERFLQLYEKATFPQAESFWEKVEHKAAQIAKYFGIPALILAAILPIWQHFGGLNTALRHRKADSVRREYAQELAQQGEFARAERIIQGIGKDPLEGDREQFLQVFAQADHVLHGWGNLESAEESLEITKRLSSGFPCLGAKRSHNLRAKLLLIRLKLVREGYRGVPDAEQELEALKDQVKHSPQEEPVYRFAVGQCWELKGQHPKAQEEYSLGVQAAEKYGNKGLVFEGQLMWADDLRSSATQKAELDDARQRYEEVLKQGSAQARIRALYGLATLDRLEGHLDEAEGKALSYLYLSAEADNQDWVAGMLSLQGIISHTRGTDKNVDPSQQKHYFDQAARLYRESETLARKIKSDRVLMEVLEVQGQLARDRADYEAAQKITMSLVTLALVKNWPRQEASGRHVLGTLAQARFQDYLKKGQPEKAQEEYRLACQEYNRSLEIKKGLNDPRGMTYTLYKWGELQLEKGAKEEGARLLTEAWPFAAGSPDSQKRIEALMKKNHIPIPPAQSAPVP